MSLQAGYSKLLPGVNFAIKRRSGSLLVSQIAILTATPTNFREKARSAANDEPCEPASGGLGEYWRTVFAEAPLRHNK